MVQQTNLAAIGQQQRRENADQTRFTGAVRTQQAIGLALVHHKRNVIESYESSRAE
jgi:hypothetical protein